MEILELSVIGKNPDQALCEDVVVVTDQLVAVIDGDTDKSGFPVLSERGTMPSGRFAALVVADALERCTPGQAIELTVSEISSALGTATKGLAHHPSHLPRPAASVVVFDAALRVVWRVGDCHFRIDNELHKGSKLIDDVAATYRAAFLAASFAEPGSPDTGREAILPLLQVQGALANNTGEFGYGVIDGRPVPPRFIEVFDIPDKTREIVLASDGYPTLPESLSAAEAELGALLAIDPACTGPLRGTKGVVAGNSSFDDRAWVRLVP